MLLVDDQMHKKHKNSPLKNLNANTKSKYIIDLTRIGTNNAINVFLLRLSMYLNYFSMQPVSSFSNCFISSIYLLSIISSSLYSFVDARFSF